MNILVTGGLGFIGSNFVNPNHRRFESITIVDPLQEPSSLLNISDAIHYYKKNITVIREPIQEVVKTLRNNFDVIIHFGARTHVDNSITSASSFIEDNINGTYQLVNWISKTDKRTRFLHVSTDEVYGSTTLDRPWTESSPLNASNNYSITKQAAEQIVRNYIDNYGINGVITRGCNTIGPNQYPEKLIPLTILKLFHNEPIEIYGTGKAIRQYITVEEHNKAIEMVAQSTFNCVFNIAPFKGSFYDTNSIINLVTYVYKQSYPFSDFKVNYIEDRLGHDMCYNMDSTLFYKVFGYKLAGEFNENPYYYIKELIRLYPSVADRYEKVEETGKWRYTEKGKGL